MVCPSELCYFWFKNQPPHFRYNVIQVTNALRSQGNAITCKKVFFGLEQLVSLRAIQRDQEGYYRR